MADHYYQPHDLARFPDIGKNAPELAKKFFEWYGAVFADGAESKLITPALKGLRRVAASGGTGAFSPAKKRPPPRR